MRFLGWIVTLPLFLLMIVFALENKQSVTLDFFLFDFQATLPLSLLAIGLLLLGFVLGTLTSFLGSLSRRVEVRGLKREKAALSEELAKRPPLVEERRKRGFRSFRLPFLSNAGDSQ